MPDSTLPAIQSRNCDVYDGTIRELVLGCMNGLNVTVFAYGATGSGKTYTMVGTPNDPGLMVLSLQRIFRDRQDLYADEDFDVTCSYIEVYNEVRLLPPIGNYYCSNDCLTLLRCLANLPTLLSAGARMGCKSRSVTPTALGLLVVA